MRITVMGAGLTCALLAAFLPRGAHGEGLKGGAEAAVGFCKLGETVLYNCSTTNHKIASVCATRDRGAQYRCGTTRHIEMVFPTDAREGPTKLLWSHYSRPMVERLSIRFVTPEAEYWVHDWIDEENRVQQGVWVILTGSDRQLNIPCRGRPTARPDTIARLLTCDEESALAQCRKTRPP